MTKDRSVNLKTVESTLQLKTWWAMVGVLPIANRLVVQIVNKTKITPNQISVSAFFSRVASGVCFVQCSWSFYVAAAAFYYLAYLLDCTDGPVARLTNSASEFGRYLDHLSDLIGDLFILLCIFWGRKEILSILGITMCLLHIFEAYISYLSGLIINNKNTTDDLLKNLPKPFRFYENYRQFFFKRNMKSFISFPDYQFFLFIVFPLFGMPANSIIISFLMLICIVLYTVFSTFWTIHIGDGNFP